MIFQFESYGNIVVSSNKEDGRLVCVKGSFENCERNSKYGLTCDEEQLSLLWSNKEGAIYVHFSFFCKHENYFENKLLKLTSLITGAEIIASLSDKREDVPFSLPVVENNNYGTCFSLSQCIEFISLSQTHMLDWLDTADHIVSITKTFPKRLVCRDQLFKFLYANAFGVLKAKTC